MIGIEGDIVRLSVPLSLPRSGVRKHPCLEEAREAIATSASTPIRVDQPLSWGVEIGSSPLRGMMEDPADHAASGEARGPSS